MFASTLKFTFTKVLKIILTITAQDFASPLSNFELINQEKYLEVHVSEHYTEANSGGVARGGSGYFSRIPTITSESGTHLSSNFTTGTFPSGFTSKNLAIHHKKKIL